MAVTDLMKLPVDLRPGASRNTDPVWSATSANYAKSRSTLRTFPRRPVRHFRKNRRLRRIPPACERS
jgi:hypothetical protein